MGSQVPENVLYTLSCTHPASSKYSLSTAHTVTHTVGVPGEQEKEIQLAQDTLSLRGGGKFLGGSYCPSSPASSHTFHFPQLQAIWSPKMMPRYSSPLTNGVPLEGSKRWF